MSPRSADIITLTEYQPTLIPKDRITDALGKFLWRNYNEQISVDWPSPKTDGQWQITAKGWVGYIPAGPELGLRIEPKVPLRNLFGMLEYAYRLKSFKFFEGLVDCDSLEEFYERLATVLSRRVIDRSRKGLYRTYVEKTESLSCVRGRLNLRRIAAAPWKVELPCSYHENSADIEDNQILSWTLHSILETDACTERSLPSIRRAYRVLRGIGPLQTKTARACVGRLYNRLNDDYQPMHALCRFFLEHRGPAIQTGTRRIMPFLVNMARLFELFVAEWLKAHLPQYLRLTTQEQVHISPNGNLHFDLDLVLYDVVSGRTICVLDTKYKLSDWPEAVDVAQVVAYCEAKDCRNAVLVYPATSHTPLDTMVGSTRVVSSAFSLAGDLEAGGTAMLKVLLTLTSTRNIKGIAD